MNEREETRTKIVCTDTVIRVRAWVRPVQCSSRKSVKDAHSVPFLIIQKLQFQVNECTKERSSHIQIPCPFHTANWMWLARTFPWFFPDSVRHIQIYSCIFDECALHWSSLFYSFIMEKKTGKKPQKWTNILIKRHSFRLIAMSSFRNFEPWNEQCYSW